MTRKPLVLAGLCVALLAAPAFAQQGVPGGSMPPPSTSTIPSSPSTGGTIANPSKPKAATGHHAQHMAQATQQRSCWDLAWESQAMKNCFARHPAEVSQHPQAAQMLNQSGSTLGNRY